MKKHLKTGLVYASHGRHLFLPPSHFLEIAELRNCTCEEREVPVLAEPGGRFWPSPTSSALPLGWRKSLTFSSGQLQPSPNGLQNPPLPASEEELGLDVLFVEGSCWSEIRFLHGDKRHEGDFDLRARSTLA